MDSTLTRTLYERGELVLGKVNRQISPAQSDLI